jgi:hypothetical protein
MLTQARPVYGTRFLTLWELEKKGNGTFAAPSAAIITDETQPWLTPFHEILTTILGPLQ